MMQYHSDFPGPAGPAGLHLPSNLDSDRCPHVHAGAGVRAAVPGGAALDVSAGRLQVVKADR